LIAWTAQAQGAFYDGLTSALRQVSDSPAALWTLLGLSFAYGVAHAAGPGHGKVVISSYMLASGDTARRGAMLAVGAALVQATVAVVLVAVLAGAFRVVTGVPDRRHDHVGALFLCVDRGAWALSGLAHRQKGFCRNRRQPWLGAWRGHQHAHVACHRRSPPCTRCPLRLRPCAYARCRGGLAHGRALANR
jgi:ABC-type nickel/cobalt efflux system permease component RcnA